MRKRCRPRATELEASALTGGRPAEMQEVGRKRCREEGRWTGEEGRVLDEWVGWSVMRQIGASRTKRRAHEIDFEHTDQ